MRKQRAQSTIEYALLVLVVVAAFLSMVVYMKRGVQGNFRAQSDNLAEQYDPRQTTSSMTMTRTGTTTSVSDMWEDEGMAYTVSTTLIEGDTLSQSGTEKIGPMGGLWD